MRRVVAIVGLLGIGMAQAAAPDDPASVSASASASASTSASSSASTSASTSGQPASAQQAVTAVETAAPRIKATGADAAPREKTKTPPRDIKDTGDPLTADVLGDADLANQRGGSETHLNQNNANGTVTGNVASQLNTGSNTISENSFSNTAGIPIVIQNSGNNVLIQNSTILNLQLTNPK
jgi:hypothetical protein